MHKSRTGCNGVADKLAHLEEGKGDLGPEVLAKDALFLEHLSEGIEQGRSVEEKKSFTARQKNIMKVLKRQCGYISFLPHQFSRAKTNRSRATKDGILWTVELDGELLHEISDDRRISDFVGGSEGKVLILSHLPGKKPLEWVSKSADLRLKDALNGISIIEYPQIKR